MLEKQDNTKRLFVSKNFKNKKYGKLENICKRETLHHLMQIARVNTICINYILKNNLKFPMCFFLVYYC